MLSLRQRNILALSSMLGKGESEGLFHNGSIMQEIFEITAD